jgi:hypothetical protein
MQTAQNLRHGKTWFVGVDALPNAADGSIAGAPLRGAWRDLVPELPLHRAQLSIIFEGYPRQDPEESAANHRYRLNRCGAHVDGLLPIGADKRRFAREFHAYILALPLTKVTAAPTVIWRGSHKIMQRALRDAIRAAAVGTVDVTDAYQSARREVFAHCEQVPLRIVRGQAALLHPFILHGTQRWGDARDATGQGRMTAFFRPECKGGAAQWLAQP